MTGDLEQIRERRIVRALVAYSKTDFYIRKGKPSGAIADLLHEYEKVLNEGTGKSDIEIKIVFIPVRFDQLIPSLLDSKGDLIASTMTITPEREALVDFVSGRRLIIDEVVVTNRSAAPVDSVQDLSGRCVYVLRAGSFFQHLELLNKELADLGKEPADIVESDKNLSSEDILELVYAGVVEMTVMDDFKADLWAQVLPNIVVRKDLELNTDGNVGWAVRKSNPELKAHLGNFFETIKKGSMLGNILFKRHYPSIKWIKHPVADEERKIFEQMGSIFKKYSDEYGFDYLAITAQAFQESALDHSVRSAAGAVGVMQVLPSTAADPNVYISDIEELENNIHAGVKYMAFLRDRYFKEPELTEDARRAFLWASYNAGPAKVRKLRTRASEIGLNPNKWFFNVEHAAQDIIGHEAVRYVSNIYKYYIAYQLLSGLSNSKQ